jgi:hypothetical protein
MAILPRSIYGRVLAVIWLCICIAILLFGYSGREIHDMPIAVTWFMLFVSAPAGILVALVIALITPYLHAQPGYTYEPFLDLVPFWIGCTVLGYFQWFVAVPLLWRRLTRGKAI